MKYISHWARKDEKDDYPLWSAQAAINNSADGKIRVFNLAIRPKQIEWKGKQVHIRDVDVESLKHADLDLDVITRLWEYVIRDNDSRRIVKLDTLTHDPANNTRCPLRWVQNAVEAWLKWESTTGSTIEPQLSESSTEWVRETILALQTAKTELDLNDAILTRLWKYKDQTTKGIVCLVDGALSMSESNTWTACANEGKLWNWVGEHYDLGPIEDIANQYEWATEHKVEPEALATALIAHLEEHGEISDIEDWLQKYADSCADLYIATGTKAA